MCKGIMKIEKILVIAPTNRTGINSSAMLEKSFGLKVKGLTK